MDNPEPTRAPVSRLSLALPAPVADALTISSFRESRPGKQQAIRYIRDGLVREGYLPADDDKE